MDFLGKLFAPLTDLIGGVLAEFHSLGAPWWLSIAFLTIIVRTTLFPLTVKQVKNMRAMQDLKPEMDEIRARHKDDSQKQQQALMELYRERKVNPMAGFLPLLVQIPVFITMYHVIRHFEETLQSFSSGGLFWFMDLTRSDPYFILPVLSASILLVSQEITSKNVNPAQKRMMRLLPIVFTVFIARFPAGLFVYWITSNTFTLLQSYLIYHRGPGKAPIQDPKPSLTQEREPPETASADQKPAGGTASPKTKKPTSARRKKRKKKK